MEFVRGAIVVAVGTVVGLSLVMISFVTANPGWGVLSHTECELDQKLGNVTVWRPAVTVAAPYRGTEEGRIIGSEKTPAGSFIVSQATLVENGSVTSYYLGFENWTIFSDRPVVFAGPGPVSPCSYSIVAFHSPNPSEGLRSGLVTLWTLYSNLTSDTGLATQLNGSELCRELENTTYTGCAVGAQFDMNFHASTGAIDTCGQPNGTVLRVFGTSWPITAPFESSGHSEAVPLLDQNWTNPSYHNVTYAWYNYTFPANGGVWQYDNLSQTSETGAGLVFAYSPCP